VVCYAHLELPTNQPRVADSVQQAISGMNSNNNIQLNRKKFPLYSQYQNSLSLNNGLRVRGGIESSSDSEIDKENKELQKIIQNVVEPSNSDSDMIDEKLVNSIISKAQPGSDMNNEKLIKSVIAKSFPDSDENMKKLTMKSAKFIIEEVLTDPYFWEILKDKKSFLTDWRVWDRIAYYMYGGKSNSFVDAYNIPPYNYNRRNRRNGRLGFVNQQL